MIARSSTASTCKTPTTTSTDVPWALVRPAPRGGHRSCGTPSPPPNRGFWAVTRYDDLTAVHMDWETYSSELGAVSLEELDDEQLTIRKSMLETDPPRHTELRRICSKRLSARGVGAYEDWIRDVARGVLDQALVDDEPFDFVAAISRELPIRFLCSIFTVPQEDAPQLISWGDQMIANQDPDLARVQVGVQDTEAYRLLPFRSPAALEVFAYADRQRDQRIAEPADDILQALTVAQSEGILNEQDFHNYFGVLMIAGQRDHAAHDLGGHARADRGPRPARVPARPSRGDRVGDRGDPALGDAGDALPPHRDPRHRAPRPGDHAAGDKVVTWYVSANRDPEVFPDPYRFDVTRTPNDHVTFGPGGPHFCLGAHLARLETRILFSELLPRIASIELAGPVERIRSNFVNGTKRMPVRVTDRRRSARRASAAACGASRRAAPAPRCESPLTSRGLGRVEPREEFADRGLPVVGAAAAGRDAVVGARRRASQPALLERPSTPVAVGRLIPTASAKSAASSSPHTHSTHSPVNAVQESRSGARTSASRCRRSVAEVRKTFEIAPIARKSSGEVSEAARWTLRSAGRRPSSGFTPLPRPAARPGRARPRGSASTSSSVVRKFTKHGRSQTWSPMSAEAR